jgi:hypothetical protein
VEESDKPAGFEVDRADVASLEAITGEARPGEIPLVGSATMFDGNNVVRFVGKEDVLLVKQTLLALLLRPLPHQGPQRGGDRFAHGLDFFFPRSLALTNRISISAYSN